MRTVTRGLLVLALGLLVGWPIPPLSTPVLAASRLSATKIKLRTTHGTPGRVVPGGRARPRTANVNDLLAYNGGRVLNVPQVYLSFWGPQWSSATYQPARDYVTSFFGAVGGSDWAASMTQYCSGGLDAPRTSCAGRNLHPITNPTSQLQGTWIDETPVSYGTAAASCGLPGQTDQGDCDVILAAQRAAQHFGSLPEGAVVMVLSPSGFSQPGFASGGWCAYHWAIPSGGSLAAAGVPFSYLPFMPDAGASCGANSVNGGAQGLFDGFSIIGGHEYAESITDPYPGTGWVDASGAEAGDKCAWIDLGNRTFGGRQLAVQPIWSNAAGGCVNTSLAPINFAGLGGVLTSSPAAASWGRDRLDVFARGVDNGLWHRWSNGGSWSGWESLGGFLTAGPAATTWGPNRLDVFVKGSDRGLWRISWDGNGWTGWEPLGGVLKDGPAAASWSGNRLDVFVRGSDDALWHRSWDGSAWRGWESLGGVLSSGPASVSWGPSRLDVFVLGTDGAVWRRGWDHGAWTGWDTEGGSLASSPAAASRGPNRLDLFAVGGDSGLSRQFWDDARWSGWAPVGGQSVTAPAAVSRAGTNSVDVFVVGAGRDLGYATLP